MRNFQLPALCAGLLLASILMCVISFASDDSDGGSGKGIFRESRFIMGTAVEITVSQAGSGTAKRAMRAAFAEVERVDVLMSHFRPDSEVSQIKRQAGK